MTLPLVHELLERSAQAGSSRIAVVDRERSLTYGELDARSNQLARALIERGVGPGDRVGLYLEKSLEAVIGAYGVMKAGAAYVPLDAQAPVARLAYIVQNAGIRCLVSSSARASDCGRMVSEGAALETVVGIESPIGLSWESVFGGAAEPPGVDVDPDSLAYILYTSGSTGEPKGVMLSHENCLAFVDWAAREVGVTAEDRLSSHAPMHFDLSTFDLYAAAWAGAPVILVPRETTIFPVEMAKFIRERRITVWYSVPSALTQLVLHGGLDADGVPELRAVIFAGEVFPTKYLARLIELVPGARYFNFFGPTETNVCTSYEVPSNEPLPDNLPIGRPIAGVSAVIEREDGTAAADGEVGELLIAGPTVMHGYWGDATRTERTLMVGADGARTYRTGDLVRWSGSELEYLGRRDAQIKTRGYRVELGDIEAALHALDVIVEAAVVAVPDELITNRIKAFVVTNEEVTEGDLARLCRDRLPHYMIPEEFEFRQELPKSSTGKVDRRALQG